MDIAFPLLNDSDLQLVTGELRLPTFRVGEVDPYRRLTLISNAQGIQKVFCRVPPDENASQVV